MSGGPSAGQGGNASAGSSTGGSGSGGLSAGASGMPGGGLPGMSCTPDAKQCNGLVPQVCDAGGQWQSGKPCDFVCDGVTGVCTGMCTPRAKQCSDLQPQQCDDQGTWQPLGSKCSMVCNGGSCAACTPQAKQCNGLQPQECDATGTWKDMGTPCKYVCDKTSVACTGSCTPTSKQCRGSQPEVCDSNGTWQSSGSACGSCAPCSTSSGTCVPSPGLTCSTGNKCMKNETCQSNGSCGGGSAESCTGADQCHTVGACVPATGCPSAVFKSGSCSNGNSCVTGETCQSSSGQCGGGTKASITTACGNNKYCDGNGACKCRTQSSWNLLKNPGFDGGTGNWTLNGGAMYATTDVDSCTGSGSVTLGALGATFDQCVPVQPSTLYYFGFRFKASGGPTSSGTATCSLLFLPSGNTCSFSESTSSVDIFQSYNNDNWIQGASSGSSESTTTHAIVHCSSPASNGFHDQFYLSASTPGVPAF